MKKIIFSALRLLKTLYQSRNIIRALAKRDVLSRYSGTQLRGVWEILNPAITLFVFWFVFSFALKTKGPSETPFIIYFITGYLPWIFFSETLSRGSQGVVVHSFLISKTVFASEVLPFVYIFTSAVNHMFLLVLSIFILLLNGVEFSWHFIQIIYYFITLCVILVGLQWILSAINVFNRDIGQGVGIALNLLFWVTPIVWVNNNVIPNKYKWIIDFNPIGYVIDGYRGSLLYHKPIWESWWHQGLFVWSFALVLVVIGAIVFQRLKPHFGDVL